MSCWRGKHAWEREAGSFFFTQTGVHVVLGIVTLAMLVLAVAAGAVSFETGACCRARGTSLKPKADHARNSWRFSASSSAVSLGMGMYGSAPHLHHSLLREGPLMPLLSP